MRDVPLALVSRMAAWLVVVLWTVSRMRPRWVALPASRYSDSPIDDQHLVGPALEPVPHLSYVAAMAGGVQLGRHQHAVLPTTVIPGG
jgi:hypothetical protein